MKRRFHIYMRMVDVSFWVSALFLVHFVGKIFGYQIIPVFRVLVVLFPLVATANQVLAIFIVLARFMRDEHAERLWQWTARRFVNVMVASCALVGLVLPIIERRVDGFVAAHDWPLPPEFNVAMFTANQAMMKGMIGGIGLAIMAFGYFAPLIFIVLYKWALWRDSR